MCLNISTELFSGCGPATAAQPSSDPRSYPRESTEPVLADLLTRFAQDEFRHATALADVLKQRVWREPSAADEVVRAAAHFSHYGEHVVNRVPTATAGDFRAVLAFSRRVEGVCGRSVQSYLASRVEAPVHPA